MSDCFGSLSRECTLEYLSKCLRKGVDQIDQKKGGAGLGRFYAFEWMNHLVVNISRGQRTQVIGIVEINSRDWRCARGAKSFNVFAQQ